MSHAGVPGLSTVLARVHLCVMSAIMTNRCECSQISHEINTLPFLGCLPKPNGDYDIDIETDDWISYYAVVNKDFGHSFGPPLTITGTCNSESHV